jgi:hypothetical protein
MWVSSLALLALLAGSPATPAGSPAAVTDQRAEGRPDCRFERPSVWKGGRFSWLGSCRGGFANGSGVIVNEVEGMEPERFYGRVQNGYLRVGVLHTTGGYVAGNWANGAVAPAQADDVAQRNVTIAAFKAAAAAASAASKSAAQKADARSSRFYADQARVLRDQMD